MNIFNNGIVEASDEVMKEVKEKGKQIVVDDNQIKITCYIYKNNLYIDDVIESEK